MYIIIYIYIPIYIYLSMCIYLYIFTSADPRRDVRKGSA